jgi:mannosyltransferase OCH1-like enzyme
MADIPKKIHYVWVGGKTLPLQALECIQSWRKTLPIYEIKLWNEENSPMNHPYVKEMYKKKKWAFVSDYIRFWALYEYGGIYLDTDMEVLKPLDKFLGEGVFFGRTSSDGYISCGIIGAASGHPFIKAILDEYDRMGDSDEMATSPAVVTKVYESYPNKDEVAVYGPEIFYPCNAGERCAPEKLSQAYTNHLWAESWVSFRRLRKFLRKMGILKLFK